MKKSIKIYRDKGIGPGGWDCPCCGPAKSHRKQWMRMVRKRIVRMERRADPEAWGLVPEEAT